MGNGTTEAVRARRADRAPRFWRRSTPRRQNPWASICDMEFPGCVRVPMTRGGYYRTDRRVEMWDSASETAFEARDAYAPHERSSRRLVDLIHRIDRARGASCCFLGSTDVGMRHPETGAVRIVQPDESVYVDARRADEIGTEGGRHAWVEVTSAGIPDVVFEVDYSTDVRRNKLHQYEAWGAPEVWVEAPNASYVVPRRLLPGLRIYLLEGGRYRDSDVSRAFPGWRAEEIHRGLNETRMSPETLEVLERVGRALAERDGTSPTDDPQTRAVADEAREQGAVATHLANLRMWLGERGIAPDPTFPGRLGAADRSLVASARPEAVFRAARAAADEDDFLRFLREAHADS